MNSRKIMVLWAGILVFAAVWGGTAFLRPSAAEVVIPSAELALQEIQAETDAAGTAWYEETEEVSGENETVPGEEEEEAFPEELAEEGSISAVSASIRNAFRQREFILPDSDSQYMGWEDVAGFSQEEISLAKDEIYARHGYRFQDRKILSFFEAKSWYSAEFAPSEFKASRMLNDVEKYNVRYLESLEKVPGLKNLGKAPSKKRVDSYGYENGYSRLSFRLKKGSLVKKDGYYEVTAVYRQAVTVPGNLEIGDAVKVSFDDLKGKRLTLVRDEEGLYVQNDPTRQFEYFPQSGRVTLYEDSADRVDKPVYEGKLYIREDAVEGRWLAKTRAFRSQLLSKKNLTFNAVTFDSKGYAVRLMVIGD